MIQNYLIRREMTKKNLNIFEKLQVSNAKTKGIFKKKKKLVSNDSELSNSARNGKKKFRRLMAVSPPFLRSSLINIIKATAIPKLTAVTHFLAEFLR